MTEEQLAEIKKRNEARTDGWQMELRKGLGYILIRVDSAQQPSAEMTTGDLAFIYHSLEDIPALIAEVERLQDKISKMETISKAACEYDEKQKARVESILAKRDMGLAMESTRLDAEYAKGYNECLFEVKNILRY